MIVKVIPIKRLPKTITAFDYNVPEKIPKTDLKTGQLVTISLRQSNAHGLILSIKNEIGNNLKNIDGIINSEPLISKNHLNFLMEISVLYGISSATMLKNTLLPIQKRKLKTITLKNIPFINESALKITPFYYFYKNQFEHRDYLLKTVSENTLIIVPEVHLIAEVHDLLPPHLQEKILIWHSNLSAKEQFSRWLAIRNNEKNIIIGTRGAIFLPFYNLKNIIIDYEHEANHKHWDQSPRYHTKDIAQILTQIHCANIHLMSFSPSCESYFHIHKNNYSIKTKNLFTKKNNLENVKIINLSEERRAGRYDFFSDEITDNILSIKTDIFILANRLGFATSAGCSACDFIYKCEKCEQVLIFHEKQNTLNCHYCHIKILLSQLCPKCGSPDFYFKGAGTETIEREIVKIFKNKNSHDIIRIDSENKPIFSNNEKPRLIIGTKMALPHLNWANTGLIILIDIDKQLNLPEYLASENAWHIIQEILFRKNSATAVYVQTFNPKQLIFKSLVEPDRFYRTELNLRQKLNYPPYYYLVRFFYGNPNNYAAQKEAKLVYNNLKNTLTEADKSIKLTHPIEMSPKYYRNKFWYVIIAKISAKNWKNDLQILNKQIPVDWKIDPNPISLLSP